MVELCRNLCPLFSLLQPLYVPFPHTITPHASSKKVFMTIHCKYCLLSDFFFVHLFYQCWGFFGCHVRTSPPLCSSPPTQLFSNFVVMMVLGIRPKFSLPSLPPAPPPFSSSSALPYIIEWGLVPCSFLSPLPFFLHPQLLHWQFHFIYAESKIFIVIVYIISLQKLQRREHLLIGWLRFLALVSSAPLLRWDVGRDIAWFPL